MRAVDGRLYDEMRRDNAMLKQMWWYLMLRGILAAAMGRVLVFWPGSGIV